MSIVSKKINNVEEVAEFVSVSVLKQLETGKKILLFLTGGSSVPVGVKIAELLQGHPLQNLTIMLTDERYVPIDHFNSNYFQLLEKGFVSGKAKMIPILINENIDITTEKFNKNLEEEFSLADYKIGLFGIGTDGHTAGILPDSIGVASEKLACHYDTPAFGRITMTGKAIKKLDEVVVFTEGKEKDAVIKDLQERDINEMTEPVQILKKVPLLTIFNLI